MTSQHRKRQARLGVHIVRVAGHAAEPQWALKMARKRRRGDLWVVDVLVVSRVTTTPRTVLADNVRQCSALAVPDYVMPMLVACGAVGRGEARSWNAASKRVLREASLKRNVTKVKSCTAHGVRKWLDMGKGVLSYEHRAFVR